MIPRQLTAALPLILAGPALAAACEIEDWRFYTLGSHIKIEGTTTCATGKLLIRAYDGGTEAYLGNATAYIEGHTFDTILQNASTESLSIKYSVE